MFTVCLHVFLIRSVIINGGGDSYNASVEWTGNPMQPGERKMDAAGEGDGADERGATFNHELGL